MSDSLPQGTAAAFQTTASVTGQITSLPVYVDTGSASTKLIVGLYADSNGRPGTLLATGTLSSPKAGSWNTVLDARDQGHRRHEVLGRDSQHERRAQVP
ncbi:MAG: hypothetical protein V9H25_16995 [Candidatus Competibacter sp.]